MVLIQIISVIVLVGLLDVFVKNTKLNSYLCFTIVAALSLSIAKSNFVSIVVLLVLGILLIIGDLTKKINSKVLYVSICSIISVITVFIVIDGIGWTGMSLFEHIASILIVGIGLSYFFKLLTISLEFLIIKLKG